MLDVPVPTAAWASARRAAARLREHDLVGEELLSTAGDVVTVRGRSPG